MKLLLQKVSPLAQIPTYQTEHSAGMDVRAAIEEPLTIQPMQRMAVPCGFSIALPRGYEAQIRARSGLSIKHGLTVVNGIGTIDADYRGEVAALLINLGTKAYTIQPGERIAQMVVTRYETVVIDEVVSLPDSARGSGGFGSTGTI